MSAPLTPQQKIMVKIYNTSTSKSVDQLPYTGEFENLYATYRRQSNQQMTRAEFWKQLTNLRKAGHLKRKQKPQARRQLATV